MRPEIGGIYEANVLQAGVLWHLVQVLGGPTVLGQQAQPFYRVELWTVYDADDDRTRLISQGNFRGMIEVEIELWPKEPVKGYCPSCDEPDMLFYDGDYLCAWCRGKLWDDAE